MSLLLRSFYFGEIFDKQDTQTAHLWMTADRCEQEITEVLDVGQDYHNLLDMNSMPDRRGSGNMSFHLKIHDEGSRHYKKSDHTIYNDVS